MSTTNLILQTAYAELLERTETAAFGEAFPEDGGFVAKTVRGKRYWYFQTGKGENRTQRYVGPESADLLERIRRHKEIRQDESERRALVSTLVRSFALPRPNPEAGDLVDALAKAGVFRLRGVLVGTVAYQTYSAMLGVKLAAGILQTGDVDIAQYKNVSLAVADRTPPVLDTLKQVDPSFQPVPHVSENNKSVSYRAKNGFRVDFLTPNEGRDDDTPQRLHALQTDAQPLRFLDFLIHDPVPAVLLHGAGVFVRVPSPERYAVHKLIVSRRRQMGTAKNDKDLRQAEALFDVLWKRRKHELTEAWHDAYRRGDTWRKLMLDSMGLIAPASRDGMLKALDQPRNHVPGLALEFPDPRPRYDFERDVVVFMGADNGGAMRCEISREVLADHFGMNGRDPKTAVEAYRARNSLFQALARTKYRAWPVEEPGVVLLRTLEIRKLLRETDQD